MTGAGDLRWSVRFDKQSETSSTYGGTVTDWQEQFTRHAHIRPSIGGEQVMAQRLTGTQPVLITVRRDSDTKNIDPSWRAVELLDGAAVRYYALKTAQDMERDNAFITMLGVIGAADA